MDEEGVLIFCNNIEVECPFCGEETHYRRKGYDGMDGEGQYCWKCNKFITQCGFDMIPSDEIDQFIETVKEYFEELKKEHPELWEDGDK